MALLRKDLKIGFLAGTLLLVLAIGYALVLTFTSPDTPTGPSAANADPAVPDPSGGTAADSGADTGVADPGAEASTAGSTAEDEWSVYGFKGQAPVVTETPTPGATDPSDDLPDDLVEEELPPSPDLNKDKLFIPPGAETQAGAPPVADTGANSGALPTTPAPVGTGIAVRTHII